MVCYAGRLAERRCARPILALLLDNGKSSRAENRIRLHHQRAKSIRCLSFAARRKSLLRQKGRSSKAMHDAAAKALNVERFVSMEYPDAEGMMPQLLAGHEQAYQAIKAERSDLQTGVTLSIADFEAGGEGSPYEEIRHKAYGVWLDAIKRSGDFTGVQVYNLIPIPGTGKPYPPLPQMPYQENGNPMASMQRPEALKHGVEYIHAQTNKPVFVTENGIETDNDQQRIWYIDQALAGLRDAIAGGVPVLGYVHWSLLDNDEGAGRL